MPSQQRPLDDPSVSAALAAVARVVRPAVRALHGPHSCIGTVRAAVAACANHGVRARPVAVEVRIHNAPYRETARRLGRAPRTRDEAEAWFRANGAHGMIVTGQAEPSGRRWAGHLCLLVEGVLLADPSLDQIARPEHGIRPPALLTAETTAAFRRGVDPLTCDVGGAEFVYAAFPHDRGYERGVWFDPELPRIADRVRPPRAVAGGTSAQLPRSRRPR